jgi:zinc protease
VKLEEVKRLVEKYFGWIPRGPEPARPQYRTPPPITREIAIATTDDVRVPRVHVAWRGPGAFTRDEPALDMASSILGVGKSSRLYRRLVYDDKIAQDVRASFAGEALGGTFEIVATAKPGVDPQQLVKAITEEVAKLAAAAPDAREVERAQNTREAGFLGGLEPTLQRAIQLASYDVQARDPSYLAKDLARYRAVSAAQIRAAAARYLRPGARVVLTINPGKKPEENK